MSALPPKATELATLCVPMEGKALLLCLVRLKVDLLRYGEGIVHVDAEISNSALYLRVA
jgi:hypothetical protein